MADAESPDLVAEIQHANAAPADQGPPPLRPFGLVLHHDGSWTHQGQPFRNRKLREKFDVSVRYLAEAGGVHVVQIGRFRGLVEVEEAGFFVQDLDLAAGRLRLSDGSTDALVVSTLTTSAIDGALLCRVKCALCEGGLLARFSHRAQAEFMNAVDDTGKGIEVAGEVVALPAL